MYNNVAEQVVYNLTMRHGEPIDFIRLVSEGSFNPLTGYQAPAIVERFNIARAVILDADMVREYGESLGATYGGFFDAVDRMILIQSKQIRKQFKPDDNDKLEFNDHRWNIAKLDLSAPIAGYVILAKRDINESGLE